MPDSPVSDTETLVTAEHLTEEDAARLREAQLDQLLYLVDEIEALKVVIDLVPENLQTGRPLGKELSLRELYGTLADADLKLYEPLARAMASNRHPKKDLPEDEELIAESGWNKKAMGAILEEVQSARRSFTRVLERIPSQEWFRTATIDDTVRDIHGLVHLVIQHDAELLRTAGHRLHESHLTDREEDLPK